MSQRESDWERIIKNEKVQTWLKKADEKVLQIKTKEFSDVSLEPGKLIPTYESNQIPAALVRYNLELLRNQSGGCLLIKRKATGLPTLFPMLEPPVDIYNGQPFQSIPELSVLAKPKSRLVNEETGIHLSWAMGILQAFLMELFSCFEQYAFGGRLKTRAKGSFRILDQDYPVDALVEADGYFESRERVVVLEAKQSKDNQFCLDFSIHQLLLPLILIRGITEKPSSGLFLDYSINKEDRRTIVRYRMYHFDIPGRDSSIDPFNYELTRSKEYNIIIA